jgi:hypothetical protein
MSLNSNIIAGLKFVDRARPQTASQFAQEKKGTMPLKVVLAVGVDSWLLTTHNAAWKSAGFIVLSAFTVREAFDHFRVGDFDLVLLGQSLSAESKERLTYLIRASSSRTPVVSIADSSGNPDSFASATVGNDGNALLRCMGELLAEESRVHYARAPLIGTAS